MKPVYKAIAWILGILMAFFSIIILAVAPLGTALSIIGILGFLMFGLIMSIKRVGVNKPDTQQEQSKVSNPQLSQLQFHSGNGRQLLESLYLIETTRNIKTLDERIGFTLQLYERFVVNRYFDRYNSLIDKEVEDYQMLYYDRTVSDIQMRLITMPNKAELNEFISQCICDSYIRYCELQMEQIQHLVRQTAIDKRYESLVKICDEYIALYDKYDIPGQANVEHIMSYSRDLKTVNFITYFRRE